MNFSDLDARLRQYFACYFNEDFDIHAPTWQGVVEVFCREETVETVRQAREDLMTVLKNTPVEVDLEKQVRAYGCALTPPQGYSAWITGMIVIMDDCLDRGIAGVDSVR